MQIPPIFIKIEDTFEKAMYFRDAGDYINSALYFGGIQLLPNSVNPYTQRTNVADGVELEDYNVLVKSMCGTTLEDITDYFTIKNNYQDDNGNAQIDWSLTNVPHDFGKELIYLEIQQLPAGTTYYTSPFMITADESEKVSRWDYGEELTEMYSVGLNIWFKELGQVENLTSYTPVSTGTPLSFSQVSYFEYWHTDPIYLLLFRLLTQIRTCEYVYVDFVRSQPYEPMETPRRAGGENFGETEVSMVRFENDKYDPLYVPPVPPPPPPPVYEIILNSVAVTGINEVSFYFNYVNFSPSFIEVQASLDGVNWFGSTGSPASPRTLTVTNPVSNPYQYRVWYLPYELPSNVIQLKFPLVNTYPNAGGAWALRKLEYSATDCLLVRNGATNQTRSIGFNTDGGLDTATLLTFANGADVFVQSWIDQSGRQVNLSQNNFANQPKLVVAGTLVSDNGNPSILFDGLNDYLEVPQSTGAFKELHSGKAFVSFVGRLGNNSNPNALYGIVNTGGNDNTQVGYTLSFDDRTTFSQNNALSAAVANGSGSTTQVAGFIQQNAITPNTQTLITNIIDCTAIPTVRRLGVNINGGSELQGFGSATPSTNNSSRTFKVGVNHRNTGLLGYYGGSIQEVVVWLNDKSASAQAIRDDINTYYDIY